MHQVLGILAIFVVIAGPVVASYLALLVTRGESPDKVKHQNRSQCLECGHELAWYDLVPLLSFPILRGRCRYCHHPIDPRIWFSELLGLIAFLPLGIYLWQHSFKDSGIIVYANGLLMFGFILFMLYSAIFDMFTFTIEGKITTIVLVIALLTSIGLNIANLLVNKQLSELFLATPSSLACGFGAAFAVYALILLTKQKAMGEGDIYIAAIMGLMLAWPNIFMALYFAIIVGGVIGLLYALKVRRFRNVMVPFVPFLLIGTSMAMIFGAQLFSILFYV